MDALLDDALDAGMLGLSTMTTRLDKVGGERYRSRPLPSTHARWSEYRRLNRVLRRRRRVLQSAPDARMPLNAGLFLAESRGRFRPRLKHAASLVAADAKSVPGWRDRPGRGAAQPAAAQRPADAAPPGAVRALLRRHRPPGVRGARRRRRRPAPARRARAQRPHGRTRPTGAGSAASTPAGSRPACGTRTSTTPRSSTAPTRSVVGRDLRRRRRRAGHPPRRCLPRPHRRARRRQRPVAHDGRQPPAASSSTGWPPTPACRSASPTPAPTCATWPSTTSPSACCSGCATPRPPAPRSSPSRRPCTGSPASSGQWFGLDAGTLRVGDRADLVVVDPAGLDDDVDAYAEDAIEAFGGLRRMVGATTTPSTATCVAGRSCSAGAGSSTGYGETSRTGQFLRAGTTQRGHAIPMTAATP